MEFVSQFRTRESISIIEVGSRDVNGTPRGLFPNANYIGLDVRPGPCVDVVIDGDQYSPERPADMVICTEVLEHTQNWQAVIMTACKWLHPGGVFVVTCAGLGRQPHSCDGGELREGEYYRNLSPVEIREAIREAGFRWQITRQVQTDLQAFAVR